MKLDDLKAGDKLTGFHHWGCVPVWATRTVQTCDKGLYVECKQGRHYLDGQIGPDGELQNLSRALKEPPLKLTQSRVSLLRSLSNNGGSILWKNIGGVGKTASAYLCENSLAQIVDVPSGTFLPNTRRLQITDAGRTAIGST